MKMKKNVLTFTESTTLKKEQILSAFVTYFQLSFLLEQLPATV